MTEDWLFPIFPDFTIKNPDDCWISKVRMNIPSMTVDSADRSLEVVQTPPQLTTIGEAIRFRAERAPGEPAIVSSRFAPLSYRELQNVIRDARHALRAAGFTRGARIAVAMPNGPQAALAIVAVSCSAVSIPLNPRQTLREIETGFASLPPDAVLLVKGSDSVVRRVADRLGIRILEAVRSQDGGLGFSIDAPEASLAAALREPDEPDPDAPAFILQTSGTTAKPKLIPTAHRNMLAAAARVQSWFDLTPQDRCLCVSPVFYAHGLHVMIFTPLLSGGSIAFPKDPSRFDYAEWFEALRPTWYSAGPTLHRLVFDQTPSRADPKAGHSLRFILSGGAPLSRDILEGLPQRFGVPVVEHYGSSEGMQICSNQLKPGRSRLGTVGIPAPDTVMIMADDGSKLPAGHRGEILVGGPTVVAGYLNAPEISHAAFVNGWFRTGDIGSIDEDGFLTLHGRKDDLINRGGEKISPVEIDEALLRHPAVAEAAAFSVAHSRLGEDVAAAVVLRPGMTVTSIELRRYLQDQLASFKVPGQIIIRNQLPKGKTGKIVRREIGSSLEETVAAGAKTVAQQSEENAAINTLVVQLTELWERLLKTSPVSIDDDFSEKGGDSLLAMEMLSEVERLTGQTVPTTILFEARTIRQLSQMLFEQHIQPKPVTKMNPSGSLPPVFLFHGDYNGGGLYAARLAALLGSEQPLFVVAPHDLGQKPVPLSIQAIAADRLPLVREAQPKGPYRLTGYCLGGLIAFEVARQLIASGEKVEMVSMIDSPTVSGRLSFKLLLSAMRRARPLAGAQADRVMKRIYFYCSQIDRPMESLKSWLRNVFRWRHNERDANLFAAMDYAPNPVAVPVLYFTAEYGSAGWRQVSSDIETIELVGDHSEVVRDPANLAKIASHLRTRLQAGKQAG